jgi:predicted MFS family arabinose efflux permease
MKRITQPWSQLSGLPRPVWALFTATLVNRAGTMVLPFMVLYLTHSLGLTPGRASLALAAYGFGAVLTAPVAGRLADRVGARRVIVSSMFASATLLMIFPLARTLPAILAMTFIWSVAAEALRPASLAWMTDLVPPDRRRAGFALTRLAVNLGMSIGPAVAGFVVGFSFTAIFILDAATSLIAGSLLLLWTSPQARPAAGAVAGPAGAMAGGGAGPGAGTEPGGGGAEPSGSAATRSTTGPSEDRRAHLDRRFIFFLAAILPAQIVFFQHTSALALYLTRDLGLTESAYGLIFTINTLMVISIEVPLNAAISEWSHRASLAAGALLTGIGFGGLAFATGFPSVAAMVVVWTFGEMVLLPGSAAFVAEAAPPARRGEYLGFYSMSFSFAFAVAPWLGAQVMEAFGTRAVWGAAFASGLLSAALVMRVRPAPAGPPAVSPPASAIGPAGGAADSASPV